AASTPATSSPPLVRKFHVKRAIAEWRQLGRATEQHLARLAHDPAAMMALKLAEMHRRGCWRVLGGGARRPVRDARLPCLEGSARALMLAAVTFDLQPTGLPVTIERRSAVQLQPMHLAHHRVAGDAQLAGDDGCRLACRP